MLMRNPQQAIPGLVLCNIKYLTKVMHFVMLEQAAENFTENPKHMVKRIGAIAFIFLCSSVAWSILGATIFSRTYSVGSTLSGKVESNWGSPEEQAPPAILYLKPEEKTITREEKGQQVTRTEMKEVQVPVAIEGSKIQADFHLDYRQKGLLWFSTYAVDFAGEYAFRNPTASEQKFFIQLPFPAKAAVYDNVQIFVDGKPAPLNISGSDATAQVVVPAGGESSFRASYHSRGLDCWKYKLGHDIAQARDFHMKVNTDFSGFDFPENSLSPTEKHARGNGWQLDWDYQNLVSGFDIALKMPEKLQPGPLAGRISFFAPVSLFFFFFLIFILSTIRGLDIHPMNYFFLACAFFAFHLLLAYLADHVSIHVAFLVSSIVSITLVVSYLRLVVNLRFAVMEAGVAQLVYLVLFSYAFFFEGFTGLAVTIGAVATLFVVMQTTGKIRWEQKFVKLTA